MFTGIVEATGKVLHLEKRRGQTKLALHTNWNDLALGESIAVNGVCLTVAEMNPKGDAHFHVSEESLERSTLSNLEAGSVVNLERAITPNSRLGGHWVQGHVDVKGLILNISEMPDHHKLVVALDPKYGKYCVEKGSITIDGISLTINELHLTKLQEFVVSFAIVPHTWKNTTLKNKAIGEHVNVEVDVLAKYVESLCNPLKPQ